MSYRRGKKKPGREPGPRRKVQIGGQQVYSGVSEKHSQVRQVLEQNSEVVEQAAEPEDHPPAIWRSSSAVRVSRLRLSFLVVFCTELSSVGLRVGVDPGARSALIIRRRTTPEGSGRRA
jgi:hypothetical protein